MLDENGPVESFQTFVLCVCVCACVSNYCVQAICEWLCLFGFACVCVCVCVYKCVCERVKECIHVHTCMYVCMGDGDCVWMCVHVSHCRVLYFFKTMCTISITYSSTSPTE